MSEITDRQDAASDIDPIAAAQANDSLAAAAVEGYAEADEPLELGPVLGPELGNEFDELADAVADALLSAISGDDAGSVPDDDVGEADRRAAALADDLSEAGIPPATFAAGDPAELIDVSLASEAMPAELADQADTPADTPLAAFADTVVELESEAVVQLEAESKAEAEAGTNELDTDDDGPLLDSELEHGIASVFAALHAAAMDGATPVEPLGELEAADGITFRLLGELDRLWHRAA